MRAPLDFADDQTRVLENVQMTRDRRLRNAETTGCLADRGRAEREALDDAPTDRVSQRLKRIVSQYANNLHIDTD